MSDFTSDFLSFYVAGITILGIVGCGVLLWMTARKKVESASDNTTGHVWDEDLREMNNPMPRWWMWLFVITIIFAFAYLSIYPSKDKYSGKLNWTQTGAYDAEVAKANAELEPLYARFASMKPEEIAVDPQAVAIGERLFMNNCAQCHGSDANGSKGFPNLTDNDWLYGGTPEKIHETLVNGRMGNMPPMAAAVGTPEEVRNLANYVLSLSGSPHDSLRASLGKSKFVACAACHGLDGKDKYTLREKKLTDDIWLHGRGETSIVNIVNNGKVNVMPAQADKLTEAQINVLAAYVWGMSNKLGTVAQ